MKVKVIKKSFYANTLNKVGDIIEIKEKEIPSWAEAIENKPQTNQKEKAQGKLKEHAEKQEEKQQEAKSDNIEKEDKRLEEYAKLNPDELKEKLETLLNDAIDKGFMIDFDDKSDIQLIIELEDLLKEKE